jgi:hypothetical protein
MSDSSIFESTVIIATDAADALTRLHADERDAVMMHREGVFDAVEPKDSAEKSPERPGSRSSLWGLALSGGGIRSATFSLGVLQALAKVPLSNYATCGGTKDKPKDKQPLLARFDFLSTVSGGGYAGSFYSSLFRNRANETTPPDDKAKDAYASLAIDPPGRMGSDGGDAITRPLRWLRENGRYLAPTNTGDFFIDLAIALRNLCAVHYVIGLSLLTIFLSMLAFRHLTVQLPDGISIIGEIGQVARWIEAFTQPIDADAHGALWMSPWFGIAAIVSGIALVPLAAAYWLEQGDHFWNSTWLTRPLVFALFLLGAGIGTLAFLSPAFFKSFVFQSLSGTSKALLLFNLTLTYAIVFFLLVKAIYGGSTRIFRSKVTRWLTNTLIIVVGIALFATVESAGQTLYLWLITNESKPLTLMSLSAVGVAVVAALRQFAPMLSKPKTSSILSSLSLNMVLGMIGVPLLFALMIAWQCTATAIFFAGVPPMDTVADSAVENIFVAQVFPWIVLAFCIFATIAAGVFLGFINLSGLQTMYSARLTRAYLGASNQQRFATKSTRQNVTEPHPDDDFSFESYYQTPHRGPAHIINVTINATTGSGDQLTQRDRQGLPMCVTPAGTLVNGEKMTDADGKRLVGAPMTIGQWVGISGAAFTTGIGRGTGLGSALVFGLCNVRLGWWWASGKAARRYVLPFWRNQLFLSRELRAHFVGTDDSHWYLSDGGHYENTGVLELLRRRVHFILACDCGADADYTFEDLANLMRIARIDLGAEFTLVPPNAVDLFLGKNLDRYFAADESDLKPFDPKAVDNKCALLYRVTFADPTRKACHVLFLKPRLIGEAPLDLFQYQSKNPSFPQQTTFDQFFDEAQWESYRKLGVTIGSRIFS